MGVSCCRYVFDGKPPELKKEELGRRYVLLSSLLQRSWRSGHHQHCCDIRKVKVVPSALRAGVTAVGRRQPGST